MDKFVPVKANWLPMEQNDFKSIVLDLVDELLSSKEELLIRKCE